jgi:hypothetical protein
MIQYVQKSCRMGGSTNSTFLALIPKERKAVTFSRFRPISLCNVSYKIISNIIAIGIQKLFPKLISPSQGGFVARRKIWDNIVLVQEVIHSNNIKQT